MPDAWLKTNVFIIIGPGTAPLTNLSRELSPMLKASILSSIKSVKQGIYMAQSQLLQSCI